jgi:sulfur-oxidizing protein SoxZ
MAQARISVPRTAARGEIIEIKTLIQHPMETGFRRDLDGEIIPVHIIERLVCTYDGEEVFRADLHPSIAANPFLTFHTVATVSGRLEISWHDDDGSVTTASAEIEVT